jgi:replicative DNA helicase
VFGLEMSKEELALRRTCARAGVDYQRVKESRGRLRDEDWDRLNDTAPSLARLPIWVEDFQPRDGQPGAPPTMAVIRSKLRRVMAVAKKQHVKIACVVFDYLQLGDPAGLTDKKASREEKVTAMSRAWKALAREFGVHVILVSQFSREVVKEDRRPKMSDLRESGAIEQDANNILFIYHLNEKEVQERIQELQKQGAPVDEYEFALQMGYSLAALIIEKQRGGAAKVDVDVAWEAKFTTFIDLGHLRRYHYDGELFEPLEDEEAA